MLECLMHTITIPPFEVTITWHLPEVDWHDASVRLRSAITRTGTVIASWQIDTSPADQFEPDWSCSASLQPFQPLEHLARIRVPRHDGPCIVAVRVFDTEGAVFTSTFSRNRR